MSEMPKVYVSRKDDDNFLLEGCGICGCASLDETTDDLISMNAVTFAGHLAAPTLPHMMIGESITFYIQ